MGQKREGGFHNSDAPTFFGEEYAKTFTYSFVHATHPKNRSGWGEFYNSDPPRFLGGENATEQTLNYPGFGTTAIDWLVKNSDFVGIGVDSLSIELGRTQACYVHRTLTSGNRYGLECLANLDLLPPKGFSVTTLPLNIAGGSGGPCRVVARV